MGRSGHGRGWIGRRVGAVALIIGMAAAAALPAGASANVERFGLRTKGSPHPAGSSGNLVDHGGKVLSASHTYTIFWGPGGAWSSDVVSGVGSLFGGFNGSGYLGIAGQYMRGAAITSTFNGTKTDASVPPKKVSAATLGSEVAKEYGTALDPNGIYFVYTSNFPSGGGFCAWHSLTTVSGQSIAVAYMPNTTGVAGCDPGNLYSLSGSEGLRSLANVTAHEYMEAVTDTLPSSSTYGWIDNGGSEIGDKCAWQFAAPVRLSNGSTWQLQEEWSNSIFGCAQG